MATNGNNNFSWNLERWKDINQLVYEAAKAPETRKIRPHLKLYGKQGGEYIQMVTGHQIRIASADARGRSAGSALSIDSGQRLTPTKISCDFLLHQEQFHEDDAAANVLATEAAYRVAAAEEAIILLGRSAGDFLKNLNVDADHLEEQTGLFAKDQKDIGATVLESVLQGIRDLQANGRFGNYVAIVSLDLYKEAMKPRQNPFDAQIYEIRPLLVENGFLYSQAAPGRTGVIFSTSGDSLKISLPVDLKVEFVEERKDVTLQVVEQMRLLIDVPEAVVPLK